MAVIDFDNFPQALAANEQRIDLQTGHALRPTLDNEFFLHEWVKANTQALDYHVDQVQQTADDAAASVVNESIARANGDSALAANISTLSTTVGSNSAQLTVLAASINGVEVKFGVMGYINGVTGGFVFTGIQQLDGSVSYDLEITSNVIIHGDVFIDGTLTTSKVAANAITSMAVASGVISAGYSSLAVTKSFYGGTDAYVVVSLHPSNSLVGASSTTWAATLRSYPFYVDSVAIDSLTAWDQPVGGSTATVRNAIGTGTTDVVGSLLWGPAPVTKSFIVSGLSAGTHQFAVNEPAGNFVNATIAVTEFKR